MNNVKQTAANNKTLLKIKIIFNAKIYKRALAIMNSEGEAATMEWLQQFVTVPIAEVLDLE